MLNALRFFSEISVFLHHPALKIRRGDVVIHRYHGYFRWLGEKEDGLNTICRVKGGEVSRQR